MIHLPIIACGKTRGLVCGINYLLCLVLVLSSLTCWLQVTRPRSTIFLTEAVTSYWSGVVSPPAIMGRYIMKWMDFRGSQFPDDEDRDGPWNVGLLTTQPPDAAASLRIFYWIHQNVPMNYFPPRKFLHWCTFWSMRWAILITCGTKSGGQGVSSSAWLSPRPGGSAAPTNAQRYLWNTHT